MRVMLDAGAYIPTRAYSTDAGLDIRTPHAATVPPHGSVVIDTGVHVEIPEGYGGFLMSKSGLNVVHDLTGEGVIDSSYRGSIRVKLYNHGDEPHGFEPGDKIIQLVVMPVWIGSLELVRSLTDTARGSDGFGSTGR